MNSDSRYIGLAILFAILIPSCGEDVPLDPVFAVRGDSVYIDLDPNVTYEQAYLYLGHGGELFDPLGKQFRALKNGGAQVFPLRAWSYRDVRTMTFHYLWKSEKPEYAWLTVETSDGLFAEWLWYRTGKKYALLERCVYGTDRRRIDSLLVKAPDSLREVYDRAVITFTNKYCGLPPLPDVEEPQKDKRGSLEDSTTSLFSPDCTDIKRVERLGI